MHYLSLAAMFRQENSWLDEWILYHRAVGVEHLYLFNHDKDTCISDRILKPYVEQGFVDNIPVGNAAWLEQTEQRSRQNAIYREMIRQTSHQTQWLGLIDLDEFILPKQCDDLREVMQDYEAYSGLAMNWSLFGTNGYLRRPPTQINHLLRRSRQEWEPNRYIKSIIRPERVDLDQLYDAHHFPCKTGYTVNENEEKVGWMQHDISTNKIRLNHYVLRSLQDFWEVKAVRPRYNSAATCDEEYFETHDRNDVYDDEISRRFGSITVQMMEVRGEHFHDE